MNIKNYFNADQCRIGLCYILSQHTKIKSADKFRSELSGYFYMFGISCIDDHESECGKYFNDATDLLEKYLPETKHLLTKKISNKAFNNGLKTCA